MGSAKAHYEGIKAFSETDQTDDLKAITVPVLVMQGDDDQVVPYKNAALLQDKLLSNSTLRIYPGYPHGMHTSHADVINADILAFIKSKHRQRKSVACALPYYSLSRQYQSSFIKIYLYSADYRATLSVSFLFLRRRSDFTFFRICGTGVNTKTPRNHH